MKLKQLLSVLFGLGFILTSQIANATPVTLTFDATTSGNSYSEGGMTITATSAEPVRTNGRWFLDCCDSGPETFSLTTGGIFDLLSVFIGHVDSSDPVIWTGYLLGSVVATNSYNTGQNSTYNFSGLTGVDLVTVSVSGTWTDPSFDNLTYASNVPEPTTIAILGLGLAGIGFSRKIKSNM
jgi:hypothetical protein